ncbi:hypothetical protein RND71_034207 [Anisodus tanguticus]|uniref:Uncharacterized protein n=1 Tax=Anisodus tanguticus TaxID=243964 RepID=A0AAE1RAX4_9SOLA|nr:hypothetical protein RND71_034207 [Anisodus tanguticus]
MSSFRLLTVNGIRTPKSASASRMGESGNEKKKLKESGDEIGFTIYMVKSQGRNLASSTLNVNLVNDDIKVTLGANIEEKITASPKKMAGRHGFRLMEGSVDSFHPSTPGHSPGIGHSKHD